MQDKLPSYDEMIEKRTFDQGMRRANKAEAIKNHTLNLTKNNTKAGRRGRGRGNSRTQEARLSQPSAQGKGERKFHSANEKLLLEMENRTSPSMNSGSLVNDHDAQDTAKGNGPLPDSMKARLAALYDDEDDYFTI